MTGKQNKPGRSLGFQKRRSAFVAGSVGALMLGLSFASVPLYRMFCAATGYGGTTQVAERESLTKGTRKLTVRFDTNVASGLPWQFEPETPEVALTTGETTTVFFKVKNLSERSIVAQASYNVSPDQAGSYFDKLACFCFSQQTLGPHESAEWPVVFFLDPALEKDETMAHVDALTLSYTFFAFKGRPAAEAAAPSAKPKT